MPQTISNYAFAASVLAAVLITIVNDELLHGQSLWVRMVAAAVMALAVMSLYLFVAKRLIKA